MFITKKRFRQLEERISTLAKLSGMQSNINMDTFNDIKELFDNAEDNVDWQDQYNEITTKRIQALERGEEEDEEICDYCQGYDEGHSDGYKKAIEECAKKKKKK